MTCVLAVSTLLCSFRALASGIIQDVTSDPAVIAPGETVTIGFRLSQPAGVTLTVFDSDFATVWTYKAGRLGPGAHGVRWDGTDESGKAVPDEAYAWRIDAGTDNGTDRWEPAWLYSRPMEHIVRHQWAPDSGALGYRIPFAMRMWVRIGLHSGACMRLLVEGEPRPAGDVTEKWDFVDESCRIDLHDRLDLLMSIFGYRLPYPCVIVRGSTTPLSFHLDHMLRPPIDPPVRDSDPPWQQRRGFRLVDRVRPMLRLERTGPGVFAAWMEAPEELRRDGGQMIDRIGSGDIRWFIDGRCATEESGAAVRSVFRLPSGWTAQDGGTHFVTANFTTDSGAMYVASVRIE